MSNLLNIQKRYLMLGLGDLPAEASVTAFNRAGLLPQSKVLSAHTIAANKQAGHLPAMNSERGLRTTPENQMLYLTRQMWVDPTVRAAILDIREMDRLDTRVKKIHGRMARTAIKGGLKLKTASTNTRLVALWKDFERRLMLRRREKLESDCRGLVMEGNLPLQWVLGPDKQVVAGVRMPSETILPQVTQAGIFKDPKAAYAQYDLLSGKIQTTFALWQMTLVRLSPDNHDDMGSMGRPYLDAARGAWKKLVMTEEDLVIRRKTRAQQRKVHQLKNVSNDFFSAYKEEIKNDIYDQTADYVIQGDGNVSAISGDANLDQIADVVHLLDTFFAGSPAPKGLFGYPGELNRDILEDLKIDYFDEIDSLQDTLAFAYEMGFRLDLLLRGINPDNDEFSVVFKERRTDSPNQRADLALKVQAMGASTETVFETAGLDPAGERQRMENESKGKNPYPGMDDDDEDDPAPDRPPRVSVTPGNARKGESATTISTR